MRRSAAAALCAALALCASLAAESAREHEPDQDQNQDLDLDLDLDQEDGTGTETAAEFLKCNKAAWCVPGHFLVILRPGSRDSHVQGAIRRLRAGARGAGAGGAGARGAGGSGGAGDTMEVLRIYSGALHGFLVRTSSDIVSMALRLPHVLYVEEDSSVFAQSSPWNLQRLWDLNGTYRPPNDGGAADVFLMDGGVQASHREIEGRVHITDFDSVPEEDGVRGHRQANHCDSHGTHVAGVVSGSDSGVAREADIHLVRVLNCQGRGTVSGALAGIEYIRAALLSRPVKRVVVLLPFVGGFSRSLNAACRDLVASGAVVVAAAGNYRDDACLYSPASEPEVITVGAVNSGDQLMSQGAGGTNFGRCVDLFAPGDDIVSASSDCSTCFTSRSGTSQAAAHAAGVAAVILSSNQNATPLRVLHALLRHSVRDTVNFRSLSADQRLLTPNRVTALTPAARTGAALLCRSVWSERSGVTGRDLASSRCRHGEEMMSCSGFSPDGVHEGENITVSGGQVQCVVSNGLHGNGVFAVARCCVTDGLRCKVHTSPESGRGNECIGANHHLTGCISRPVALDSRRHGDGRRRHGDGRLCAAKSHSVCCFAPSLECQLIDNMDHKHQVVSCAAGWTLTDCSAASHGSSSASATVVGGNGCRGNADAASVVAVCCRIRPPP